MLDANQVVLPRDIALRFVPVIRQAALRVARRLPSHVSVDDLIGAGYVGLVDAYRRFDPTRCDRFEPYAEVRIKGAMLDELRSYDPLSRDLRALATRTANARRRLENQLGRRPNDAELATELGLSLETYQTQAARMAVGPTVSVDDENGVELPDSSCGADAALGDAQLRGSLSHAVATLPDRLREVIQLYYGGELTLREIGERMGVTESRVCQLHADAVRRLRAQFALSDPEARALLDAAPKTTTAARAAKVRTVARVARRAPEALPLAS